MNNKMSNSVWSHYVFYRICLNIDCSLIIVIIRRSTYIEKIKLSVLYFNFRNVSNVDYMHVSILSIVIIPNIYITQSHEEQSIFA